MYCSKVLTPLTTMISFWFSSYNELKQILAFGLVPNQLKQIGILSRILVLNNPEEVLHFYG
jgi:hypothetical protein